ncbi:MULTISPECIES: bifunctional 4-hydroxy-2-oxoglutarate aldolase/2-dehydro-3-deoxy-phosphogluconate aldolase [unclassified Chryseobacterium]|uniref:bifunctional 4-hydroxy-2-oxoglutarate aldolase/2-dehydro-3-deoxy-phosphogluconate aldolase n=1 Tax=unclassified Chryseobacterium TaxID=2593645 RepID=UPI000D360F0B|nr:MULTISPECIES: bifunctional 4-hydroxy-2-oxoglutarate aldolase/2-dehydro-3-deoxy-phosphogluconate aldolase [unclassified Chryseobacterium]PTT78117.1 bifunctional 4-hydroxy-2-oxoglutarate aldolase/2-dehydro-3-deoxy-phosphogluconate aldolase [Chryseobacterium sp. HMWF001]PVV56016.1 bifunctional 4-hydroxy-2-oxoglutarate aldolase/2-dehydro-3-deoxy-phosphogluconate aldolase [Chryseobacterium sp. HMWF035]
MNLLIIQKIKDQKIVPLFYNESFEVSKSIVESLYKAGIRVVEYTNRGASALQNFSKLKELSATEFPELFLGIGTVKNAAEMNEYVNAGADFIITPVIDDSIVKNASERNVLLIPGCFTPSDVNLAYQNGLRMVKIFPADVVGKKYIRSIRPVFPEMEFMLTGGISSDPEDILSWMESGAVAVGLGSSLINLNLSSEELKDKMEKLLIQLK